jgi:hypothetical protein
MMPFVEAILYYIKARKLLSQRNFLGGRDFLVPIIGANLCYRFRI